MSPDFSKGLLPVIVQDAETYAVLMLGYMDHEAFQRTQATGLVTFYSRSRRSLWVKGETSGHYLRVVEIRLDCDRDAILIRALPQGPTCHRGTYTCFSEEGELSGDFLGHLWRIIQERAQLSSERSYTARLLSEGIPRLAQKVAEEAVETAIASLSQPDRLAQEAADLLYHLWVLLYAAGISPEIVKDVLRERHQRRS
ncbi:MAG: bifunctional phosphoribosyl-AMP cyclohydrolase/phosphoribosyl-ATP diphosphatase HisIE [Bacteroidia bacterium]|nr:bifunctional phosphoribosyl-AMP cyclohydrolase/phosphoribosyl-ATP diphosphatase HisIE [Bacteroidia bacterium]MDW8416003.1 bifunctional phosphoribosyl-AMP cyclohydrolase/phosphoribosyl-ATP diphosphatase HisIE [Bacteroidia bacterium]